MSQCSVLKTQIHSKGGRMSFNLSMFSRTAQNVFATDLDESNWAVSSLCWYTASTWYFFPGVYFCCNGMHLHEDDRREVLRCYTWLYSMLVFLPVSQGQLIGKAVLAEVISNKRNGATQPTYVSVPFQWVNKKGPFPSEQTFFSWKAWASGDDTWAVMLYMIAHWEANPWMAHS